MFTVKVNNVVVKSNSARAGGGIYIGSTLTLTNSSVESNSATGSAGGGGGGIYNVGTLSISHSAIITHSTQLNGGGGSARCDIGAYEK